MLIGSRILTSSVCLNCLVQIGTHCSTVNVICLPMHDIDIIFGMNYLSANNVLLN